MPSAEMGVSYSGQCNCGAVRAAIAGEPVAVRKCWCRQCQKAAARGPTHNAMFATADVSLSGDLHAWSYLAPSGNRLTMKHCAVCSTPICAQSSARPQFTTFRLGFLDEGHGLAPTVEIWTAEMPPWARPEPELESWPRQPPPPPR
jgi:hypothetical protein